MPVSAAYVVAISMLLFCGVCALVIMWTIDHFDPPDVRERTEDRQKTVAA